MNPNEAARLAAATNSHRPDWPQASLLSFITKHLMGRAYRDASVALTWVATDPASQTPARVLEAGPWWAATNSGDATPTNSVGRKCPHCTGWTVPGDGHQCRSSAPTVEFREARAALAARTHTKEN